MATNTPEENTQELTCDRQPNVTLDNEGIRHEKSLWLHWSRSAAKVTVTKKIREATEYISNSQNAVEVRIKAQEFHETANNFRGAHNAHRASLNDELEIQDSLEYFESETQWIVNFQRTLDEWFKKVENEHYGKTDSEINPQDSISNVG